MAEFELGGVEPKMSEFERNLCNITNIVEPGAKEYVELKRDAKGLLHIACKEISEEKNSDMDYKEKYEKALEIAKGALEQYKKPGYEGILPYVKNDFETIFPELSESEDERVRKFLIGYFDKLIDENSEWGLTKETREKIITWLEKQGEQNHVIMPKFRVGDSIIKHSATACPVKSSTDDHICKVLEVHDTCYILETIEGRIQEPFKWQDYYALVEQKPTEWSEEDKENLYHINALIKDSSLEVYRQEYLSNWLEDLREKKHWKPSDEQINTLFKYAEQNNKDGSILTSLYQQLKKLREG